MMSYDAGAHYSDHPPNYLCFNSANALISDLRPTTLSPPALTHLNLFLDELLHKLVSAAYSLNPRELRLSGVPAVFSGDKTAADSTGPRALGRSAVSEAELELRHWYETNGGSGAMRAAFPPDGTGNGMKGYKRLALEQAVEVMRVRAIMYCTLGSQDPPVQEWEEQAMAAWKAAGGDWSEEILAPAGLWLTAVLEHICEHVLSQMARVVARDSSIAVAGIQDFYVALCEDESVWGFFKRLKVKDSLEAVLLAGNRKRSTPPTRISPSSEMKTAGRQSPATGSPHLSKTSLGNPIGSSNSRDASFESSSRKALPPTAFGTRGSSENLRLASASAQSMRQPSSLRNLDQNAPGPGHNQSPGKHKRTPSVLSNGTKSMLAAHGDSFDEEARGRSPQDEEDEFDALVRSGETMKVSLTPSRLKTFESTRHSLPGSPTQPTSESRGERKHSHPPVPAIPGEHTPSPRKDSARSSSSADTPTRLPRSSSSVRSRSGSMQQKLTARAATTIAEQTEDEETGGKVGKGETLKDLLAAEGSTDTPLGSGDSQEPVKRTVPAVILASPPPRLADRVPVARRGTDAARSGAPPLSINRDLTTVRGEDDATASRTKKKTQAQELADFFDSTPPPELLQPIATYADPPPKKGFKGFMSKMTGSKKDSKMPRSASRSTFSDPPPAKTTGDPAHQARRQQSMQSVTSSKMAGLAPTIAEHSSTQRSPGSSPPVPLLSSASKGTLRKKSFDSKAAASAAAAVAGVGAGAMAATSLQKKSDRDAQLHTDARSSLPNLPPDLPEKATRTQRSFVDSVPETTSAAQIPTASADDKAMSSVPETANVAALAPLNTTSSEALSFKTAQEGLSPGAESDVGRALQAGDKFEDPAGRLERDANTVVAEAEQRPSSIATVLPTESDGTPRPAHAVSVPAPPIPSAPSIPLADLFPLRGLLQHATSAQECQLLLDAILTQWGVPRTSSSPSVTPEDRVAAWLLAGRDGPVMLSPTASTFSKPDTMEVEEIRTPKQTSEGVVSSVLPSVEEQDGLQGKTSQALPFAEGRISLEGDAGEELKGGAAKSGVPQAESQEELMSDDVSDVEASEVEVEMATAKRAEMGSPRTIRTALRNSGGEVPSA